MKTSTNFKSYLLFALLLMCWGPSFLLIKVSVREVSPVNTAFFRLFIGALTLILFCRIRKISLQKWLHLWKHFTVASILMSVLPFLLMNYSLQFISSGLVATLAATASFYVAILSHFFPKGETLNPKKLGGLCLGLFGIGSIYFAELLQPLTHSILPISIILISGFCFGLGTVYSRQFLNNLPPLVSPTIQLIISSIFLAPFAVLNFTVPSGKPLVAILLLGVFGTGVAFYLYYALIRLRGATFASLILIAETMTAVLLGIWFLNELLTWNILLGSILVCSGLWVTNSSIKPILEKQNQESID